MLLSHRKTTVPSPFADLTSVFGTGTGVAPQLLTPTILIINSNHSWLTKRMKIERPISTGKLNTLLCLHVLPIKLLVSKRSLKPKRLGKTNLKVGFPLRCFQRLSIPNIATLRCHWRDNRFTRGSSIPVLSY